MTLISAEKAVVIARRRKKHARPGYKLKRLFELQDAVTVALASVPVGDGGSLRRKTASHPSRTAMQEGAQ